MQGKVVSISISKHKGTRKQPVQEARLIEDYGIEGDAHAGRWHRQVSLLASENIHMAKDAGLEVGYGDFAENIATEGIDWSKVPIGSRIKVGDAELELTQIGKECHQRCAIFYMFNDCIMPKKGVFARVLKGGTIKVGDLIEVFQTISLPDQS